MHHAHNGGGGGGGGGELMTTNGDFWGLMGTTIHGDSRSNRLHNSPLVPKIPQNFRRHPSGISAGYDKHVDHRSFSGLFLYCTI